MGRNLLWSALLVGLCLHIGIACSDGDDEDDVGGNDTDNDAGDTDSDTGTGTEVDTGLDPVTEPGSGSCTFSLEEGKEICHHYWGDGHSEANVVTDCTNVDGTVTEEICTNEGCVGLCRFNEGESYAYDKYYYYDEPTAQSSCEGTGNQWTSNCE